MLRWVLIIAVLMSLSGCYYNNEEELLGTVVCDTSAVKYSTDVSAIISANCLPCHSTTTKEFGITLEGYSNLKANVGPMGRVLGAIKHSSGYFPMPKDAAQLSSCDINKIDKWVSDGALNN
ncbi:MAG TPA: hypothetical protein VK590_08950 [Saprospiraceae bacterium]|nr:hypothetical protein [Saprospiraceae bacterium]